MSAAVATAMLTSMTMTTNAVAAVVAVVTKRRAVRGRCPEKALVCEGFFVAVGRRVTIFAIIIAAMTGAGVMNSTHRRQSYI